MNVHVDVDRREGVYRVWCWDRRGDEVASYYTRGGQLVTSPWQKVGEALTDSLPTFVLPYEVAEAIVEHLDPGLNPKNALSEAVQDARATRDRLLAIIEKNA